MTQDAKDATAAHIVLQDVTNVIALVQGQFAQPESTSEFVLVTPNAIELCKLTTKGQCQTIARTQFFATLRAVARVPSQDPAATDMLAVTSDSGRLTLIKFDVPRNTWLRHAYDSFGKSGVRRTVPGAYLAVDPRGRAIMVAAIEKAKFVYPVRSSKQHVAAAEAVEGDDKADDEDADLWAPSSEEDKFHLGSALEAHTPNSVVFSVVAIDNDGASPQFACLEHHRESMVKEEKAVVVYEHDTGLNTVVRLWTHPVDRTANMLVAFPFATGAPNASLIVCAEDHVASLSNDGRRLRRSEIYFPRREDYPFAEGGLISIASAAVRVRSGRCFMVVQNELGDLFRLDLQSNAAQLSDQLTVRYLDTVPPATAMLLSCYGQLFVAAEAHDHGIFQLISDGPADDLYWSGQRSYRLQTGKTVSIGTFPRHERLQNLERVVTLPNHLPVVAVAPAASVSRRRFILDSVRLSGRGPSSAVELMSYGHTAVVQTQKVLAVNGFDTVLVLPVALQRGESTPMWGAERHGRIVASSAEGTMVFDAVNDPQVVVQNGSSGFSAGDRTLAAATLPQGFGYLQVHTHGLRHVTETDAQDWKHGFNKKIVAASCNSTQALVAFQHGGLYLFELDLASGRFEPRVTFEASPEAMCVALATPAGGSSRAQYAGVGLPGTFTIVETSGERALSHVVKRLQCTGDPSSAAFIESDDGQMYAFIGLSDKGTLIRLAVDPQTGAMIAFQVVELGAGRCRVLPPSSSGRCPYVLAVCDNMLFKAAFVDGSQQVVPISVAAELRIAITTAACSFSGPNTPADSVAMLGGSQSNVLTFAKPAASTVHVQRAPHTKATAGMTARRVVLHPQLPFAAVLFSDHKGTWTAASNPTDLFAAPRGAEDKFAWRVAVFDLHTMAVRAVVDPVASGITEADSSEAAISMAFVLINGTPIVVVGVVPNFAAKPPQLDTKSLPMIIAFRFERDGSLVRLHATTIDSLPTALASSDYGLLMAGCGRSLRGYDLGTRQLLRKCDLPDVVPNRVAHIATLGPMVCVGDVHESVVFVKYFPGFRRNSVTAAPVFVVVADHYVPRHITACSMVDPLTCAVGDRFGNIAVLRVAAATAAATNATAAELQQEALAAEVDRSDATIPKASEIMCYHVGSTVTALFPCDMGGDKGHGLVYSTVTGEFGVFLPLSQEDFDHLEKIEDLVREDVIPVAGREQRAFRSAYGPARGVVDLDYIRVCHSVMAAGEQTTLDGAFAAFVQDRRVLKSTIAATAGADASAEVIKIPSVRDIIAQVRGHVLAPLS